MSSKSTSVTSRILSYLKTGADITQAQARKRFGITNVRARMSELRQAGYAIYPFAPLVECAGANVSRYISTPSGS